MNAALKDRTSRFMHALADRDVDAVHIHAEETEPLGLTVIADVARGDLTAGEQLAREFGFIEESANPYEQLDADGTQRALVRYMDADTEPEDLDGLQEGED